MIEGRPILKPLLSPLLGLFERIFDIQGLNQIYRDTSIAYGRDVSGRSFFEHCLQVMSVNYHFDPDDLKNIPASGPLIVIANHPFGGVDGVILGALFKGLRPDAKLMGNYLLNQIEGMRESLIEVDPFERADSKQANLKGLRASMRHLKSGGCLITFPAGEVSSFRVGVGNVVDKEWSQHFSQLAVRTGANILPIYFEGSNSRLFQTMGLVHPRLRTLMLAREFCRMRGTAVRLKIGKLIQSERLERFEDMDSATQYLRLKTYALASTGRLQSSRKIPAVKPKKPEPILTPLAPLQAVDRLENEIARLPAECRLVEHGQFSVYIATAAQIPVTLKQIGRLREETFRAVDEGTGQATDLDDYDAYYKHLFMWDHEASAIVGAYRIGLTDELLERSGRAGLYTHTLFDFRPGFLEDLGPAIELGRSFICLGYQKKHASLALVWRGIGEFIVRNPQYKILFGPVSITDAYNHISKNLMVHFFREHSFDLKLSRLVKARKAPKAPNRLNGISLKHIAESLTSVDSVSAIISGFEDDEKGIPILLRHYLKLNGALLSFNVDPAFSNVIDGLILVDLRKTDAKVLQRYMGKEGYQRFMELHKEPAVVV